jgi:hypothetical protein
VPIITRFTFRTNGTCQTPRIPGIGWSYFGSDPDWGEKQASQLKVFIVRKGINQFVALIGSFIRSSWRLRLQNLM